MAVLSLLIGFLALGYLQTQALAPAQVGAGYELTWWTVDGGGNQLAGGGFVLLGTAGQPEAGNVLAGGAFTLSSGFWAGGASAVQHAVFLPLIVRN
ncbi:MAG: hypothetical protein JW892_02945 [Anaerolineae bacterium]|nr:hypothetical protein [Anaerolineae bacterium]